MRKVDTLVVDKTGTLTEGKPELESVLQTGRLMNNALAAGGESGAKQRTSARVGDRCGRA
jgi:cation transport ATPase